MGSNRALPPLSMRLATIDIGTNTVLMLIADIDRNGRLNVVKDEHAIARLGKGVDQHGMIQNATFHRVCRILADFKDFATEHGVHGIKICGTSALRDASNRQEFVGFINDQLGLNIDILSGDEEAEFTYLGGISEYLQESSEKDYAVLDIGGGSTELIVGNGLSVSSAISIDIGSVRITERLLKTSPPESTALVNAEGFILEQLSSFPILPPQIMLIGVAGTLTTLAALDLRLPEFDRLKINRHVLSLKVIEDIFEELKTLTSDQLRAYPQIHPLRADILLAGILILRETLKWTGTSQIIVSDRGLRYGMLIKYAATLNTV